MVSLRAKLHCTSYVKLWLKARYQLFLASFLENLRTHFLSPGKSRADFLQLCEREELLPRLASRLAAAAAENTNSFFVLCCLNNVS